MRTKQSNSKQGRVAKAAGDSLESWLELQHEKALYLGILAHVEKTEPHAKVVGGKLMYVGKGVADYVGVFEPQPLWLSQVALRPFSTNDLLALESVRLGGRTFAAEAKSVAGERFYKSDVTKKQQDHLDAVARAGGLALLVIEFRDDEAFPPTRRRFAAEWLSVPWTVARSAEAVTAEGLAGWEIKHECYLQRWHPGGPRSSASGGRQRSYPRE